MFITGVDFNQDFSQPYLEAGFKLNSLVKRGFLDVDASFRAKTLQSQVRLVSFVNRNIPEVGAPQLGNVSMCFTGTVFPRGRSQCEVQLLAIEKVWSKEQ